ncbi:MAG TPA: glycosyltransferase family 39 protein, partial [Chloroflexota bacterium]|nr:glycosyltransferase family 39 protein [Chloroflexota bacterium]
TARDVHPPLFFALLHALFAVGGPGYLVAKFVPIAAAQLALVVLYRLVRTLAGPLAAWCATILLLLCVPFLLLSPTVRPFTLGLCSSLLTLLLTVRYLAAPRCFARRQQVILALATAAALLSWYLQLFVLALEALLFWQARRWAIAKDEKPASVRKGGLVALAAGSLLAFPWYAFVLPGLLAKVHQGATVTEGTPTLPTILGVLAGLAQALVGRSGGLLAALALAGGALALVVGIWCGIAHEHFGVHRSQSALRRPILLAGLAFGTLEVALILARWQHPGAAGRYILGLIPFIVTLQSLALTARSVGLRVLATLGVAVALTGQLVWFGGLLGIPPHEYEADGESNFLLAHLLPGDGVLFSDHGRRGLFLLNRRFTTTYPTAVVQTSGDAYLNDTATQASAQVAALLPRATRIWYMNTEERPGRPRLGQEALAARTFLVSQARAGDSDLSLFLTRQPDTRWDLNVTLGGVVTLIAADYSSRPGPDGGVSVELIWRDRRPMTGPSSVFVHLDGADGTLLAQHDGVPAAGLRPVTIWQPGEVIDDRHGLIVPPGLPTGSYALHAGIYKAGGGRLALPDGSNQVEVGMVQVGG